jgi:hypothetical protein
VARTEARVERDLSAFTTAVEGALGGDLLCLVLYGSAAGEDWAPGRSDVNTAIVVRHVTVAVLEALAPVAARFGRLGFAVPLVVDPDFLAGARDTFAMELDDIRRQHRLLAGADLFADVAPEAAAVRRQCEQEARAKLLRLRALFLSSAGDTRAIDGLMTESAKSFAVLLRHLARLRGTTPGPRYADALAAGEALIGPLPALRHLLARREAGAGRPPAADFRTYHDEVERIVAAIDRLDA